LAFTSTVSAGCGDYLHSGHSIQMVMPSLAENQVAQNGSNQSSSAPAPCHGSQCEKRPASPDIPPPAFRIVSPDDQAIRLADRAVNWDSIGRLALSTGEFPQDGHPRSPRRPPRVRTTIN
jgi:hypothetical protein